MAKIFRNISIIIFEKDGVTVVASIPEVIYARQTDIDNAIGHGEVHVPGNAANVDQITRGRLLEVRVDLGILGVPITPIIIAVKKIKPQIKHGQVILIVSGTNLLGELTQRSIGQNVIDDGAGGLASDDVTQVMSFAPPDWSISGGVTGSSTGGYLVGAGESVFEALRQLTEQSGDHLGMWVGVAIVKRLSWKTAPIVSGITLRLPDNPLLLDGDATQAVILDLKETSGEHEQITRIYAYGAGLGDAMLKITAAEGFVTVPAGITVDWASSLLTHTASETAGAPRIEQHLSFSYIQPEDANTEATKSAAIALFNAAVAHLQSLQDQPKLYTIKCINHYYSLETMDTVVVDYDIKVGTATIFSVQDTLIIHEVTREIGTDGILYTTIKCGTTEYRQQPTDSRIIINKLKQLETAIQHASAPPAGSSGSTTQHHDLLGLEDDDHSLYLRADGQRTLTGNLPVTAGATIDGIDVSAHAATAAAHHNWPPLDSDIPASIARDSEVTAAIATHRSIPAAHHNWPLWDSDIPASIARDSEVTAAINTHRAIPDAHHPLVTVAAASAAFASMTVQEILLLANQPLRTTDNPTFDGLLLTDDFTVGANILFVDHSVGNIGINRAPDSQFDLDVLGPVRAGIFIGPHALQLEDALIICHFDGQRPFATDFTGNPTGHMGQVITEHGGVIYRPGKFGKAVQLAQSTTNYVSNPSFEINATNWGAGADTTVARDATRAYIGSASLKFTKTGSNGYAAWPSVGVSTVEDGESVTLSLRVFLPQGSVATDVRARIKDNTTGIAYWTDTVTVRDQWIYLHTTFTNTSGSATTIAVFMQIGGVAGADCYYNLDAVQVEKISYATPYCDGSLGDGHSWSGTAHASTSSRTAAYLSGLAEGSIDMDKGTLMMWIDSAIDSGVSGNTYPGIFSYWNLWNTESFFLTFNATRTGLGWSSLADSTQTGSIAVAINWNAHNFHHLALTWEGSTVTMYIDGILVGQDTSWTPPNITAANYYLGYTLPGRELNGRMDEFAITGKALTADEIRAVYESNAPVFAESSTWAWRTPTNLAWADSEGLWVRDADGNAVMGAVGVDSKAWGGLTLNKGDFLLGRSPEGYLKWEALGTTLTIKGNVDSLSIADETVIIDDSGININDSGRAFSLAVLGTTVGTIGLGSRKKFGFPFRILGASLSSELLANTSFETNLTGWTNGYDDAERVTTQAHAGDYSVYLTHVEGPVVTGEFSLTDYVAIPQTGVWFSAWVYGAVELTLLRVIWYTAANSFVSEETEVIYSYSNRWQYYEIFSDKPATASKCKVSITTDSITPHTIQNFYIDALSLRAYSGNYSRIELDRGNIHITGGELKIDAPMQLVEQPTTPPAPASRAEGNLYVKDDKLIVQYNDSGVVRYKYLTLPGTGVNWVHTTTAP